MPFIDHRTVPVAPDALEDIAENERRFRASVEESFALADTTFTRVTAALLEVNVGTTIYYTVTDDAGDGTLWDDANNTDYTGQLGASGKCAAIAVGDVAYFTHKGQLYVYTGQRPAQIGVGCNYTSVEDDYTPFGGLVNWDDIVGKPSTYPPSPHTHVEADITDLDKYTQAEVDAQQAAQDQNLIDHEADTNNPHSVTYTQTGAAPLVHTHVEADITDLNRVRARGGWLQQEYLRNDMVEDSGYMAVVTAATTTDRPAPTKVGDPFFAYAGASPEGQVTAKSLLVGQEYDWLVSSAITAYRVYVVVGNTYSVLVQVNGGTVSTLLSFTAASSGWVTTPTSGSVYPVGTNLRLMVLISEPDPTPTIYQLSYNYTTPNNEAAPAVGNIIHAGRILDSFRVNKTGQGGQDNSADLANMTVGDIIEGAGVRWAIQAITDNGTWINFTVAPAQQGTPIGVQPFNFETVTATPVTTVIDPDYWLSTPNISGFYSVDSGGEVTTESQYGIDVEVQNYTLSDDWKIYSAPSAGGVTESGGGPDLTQFIQLIDTPASYAGQAGRFTRVNGAGAGIEFYDPAAGDAPWLPLDGSEAMTGSLRIDVGSTSALTLNRLSDTDFVGLSFADSSTTRWLQFMTNSSDGDLIWQSRDGAGDVIGAAMRMDNATREVEFYVTPTLLGTPLLTQDAGDARYLELSGGTMVGDLNVNKSSPSINLTGTGNTTPRLRMYVGDQPNYGVSMITAYADATFYMETGAGSRFFESSGFSTAYELRFPSLDAALDDDKSAVTRERGDVRYAQLSGATFAGGVVFQAAPYFNVSQIRQRSDATEISFRMQTAGALDRVRFGHTTASGKGFAYAYTPDGNLARTYLFSTAPASSGADVLRLSDGAVNFAQKSAFENLVDTLEAEGSLSSAGATAIRAMQISAAQSNEETEDDE